MKDVCVRYSLDFKTATFQPEVQKLTKDELYQLSLQTYATYRAVEDMFTERIEHE